MASTSKKRAGRHTVRALVRVYSDKGIAAIVGMLSKEKNQQSSFIVLRPDRWVLVSLVWRPRPSVNEWNTESDWRKEIAGAMQGLYFDVLAVDYEWSPVPGPVMYCCCDWGNAVRDSDMLGLSGESPEGPCVGCPHHGTPDDPPECKRHKRIMADEDLVPEWTI